MKKVFHKYTLLLLFLPIILLPTYYFKYYIPEQKPLQKATAINYEGGMVVGDVTDIEDIMKELEGFPPAGGAFDLKTMAQSITSEVMKAFSDTNESALPLATHWNVGIPEFDESMNPMYMISRIEQGEHILVSWKLDPYYDNTISDSYYEESIKKAAEIGLPLVFIMPAPESALIKDNYYSKMNNTVNPNVITKAGSILPKLSPFGADTNWYSVGEDWAGSDILQQIQEWYPNPPLVLFVSEDKADKLTWKDLKSAKRYDGSIAGKRKNFARELINNEWIKKYQQMYNGFTQTFTQTAWKENSKFIIKDTLPEVGLTDTWIGEATKTDNYMNVWPLITDAMTIEFNLNDDKYDNILNSPEVLVNNLQFMMNESKIQNSNFTYQLSINDNSKLEDIARYRGFTQFALWFLKPSIIRQVSEYTSRDELTPLFDELVDSVELIHYNAQLADFWKNGALVSSGKSNVKYRMPIRYKDINKWFLLETDVNPPRPWKKDDEIAVWSFALVKGKAPNREWLVYVQSPEGDMKDVTVSVPKYKDILVDATQKGAFYTFEEQIAGQHLFTVRVNNFPLKDFHVPYNKNPRDYFKKDTLQIKGCRGEFEPASFYVYALKNSNSVKITVSDLKVGSNVIPKENIDIRTLKWWYTGGNGDFMATDTKILEPDLLLKDDALVKVNRNEKVNYLRSTAEDGTNTYLLGSAKTVGNLKDFRPQDAQVLQDVNIAKGTNKEFWINVNIPKDAVTGIYKGKITISSDDTSYSLPLSVRVYPFELEKSSLLYSLYFRSTVSADDTPSITSEAKSKVQFKKELQNMKNHGILYPTSYSKYELMDEDLKIREELDLPKDYFFYTEAHIHQYPANQRDYIISAYQNKIESYGYKKVYFYGRDEAEGEALINQRQAWKEIQDHNAKTFVAILDSKEAFQKMGSLLNIAVNAYKVDKKEALRWHSVGSKIFSYLNPQTGISSPEIYRNNYGLLLWSSDYDGAMDYAYQHGFGHIWNDWDHIQYIDHTFTYPTIDGVIDTIAWEGHREGIDDVRYMVTLEKAIKSAAIDKQEVAKEAKIWMESLQFNQNWSTKKWSYDLDDVRLKCINYILQLQ